MRRLFGRHVHDWRELFVDRRMRYDFVRTYADGSTDHWQGFQVLRKMQCTVCLNYRHAYDLGYEWREILNGRVGRPVDYDSA